MISSFRVEGYRKFFDFNLNNLSRINFFVGKNNVGKTTLLESVFGWACGYNFSPFMGICVQRNQFLQNSTAYHIAENIVVAVNNRRNIPFSFKISGHRNMAENRKLYVHLKRHNLIEKFVQEMQEVFPEITDFDILPYQDNSMAPMPQSD